MSRGSSDNAAQGWAEITKLLTEAGRYVPTANPPDALIENICEDRSDCLSRTPTGSVAIKQKKTKTNKTSSYFKYATAHVDIFTCVAVLRCMSRCMVRAVREG